jgi:hypothetical protein
MASRKMQKLGGGWRSGENSTASLFERSHGASALQKKLCHCGKTGLYAAGKEVFCREHRGEATQAMKNRSSLSMVPSIREMERDL